MDLDGHHPSPPLINVRSALLRHRRRRILQLRLRSLPLLQVLLRDLADVRLLADGRDQGCAGRW